MVIDLNDLSGPQRRIVHEALLAAFTAQSLNQVLAFQLDKPPLVNMVSPGPFRDMVFDLINVSNLEGWTDRLIAGAERSSQNRKVTSLRETLERSAVIDVQRVEQEVSSKGRSLERLVREDGGFPEFGLWVDTMADMRRRICRIEVTEGVRRRFGTGFLLAPDLLLTNYHVVEKEDGHGTVAAADIRCRFDYAIDADGQSQGKVHGLANDWLVAHSPYSARDPGDRGGLPAEGELDYALLRLAQRVGDEVVAGKARGWVPVAAATPMPKVSEILFIVQHPKGEPLKLAVGAVQQLNGNGTRVRYDANTENGSSGSPCLDARLRLMALHHGGDPDYSKLMGDFNQGIPIALITAHMQAHGVAAFWS